MLHWCVALELDRHGPVAKKCIFLRHRGKISPISFFGGVRSKNFGSCVVWCVRLHKYKCLGMFCGGDEALCGWCGVFLWVSWVFMSFVVFTKSEVLYGPWKKLAGRSAGAMKWVVFCGSWAEGCGFGCEAVWWLEWWWCGGGCGYKKCIGRLELCVMQSLCECWILRAN